MASFAVFLIATLASSMVLVAVGAAGMKVVMDRLLARDIELHKIRLQEASDRELERVRALLGGSGPSSPRFGTTAELFRLLDEATFSIVRFSLEFSADKLDAADEAGRA